MTWRPIETAPKDETPVLLWLKAPLGPSDPQNWLPDGPLQVMVGWYSALYGWRSTVCEPGCGEDGYCSWSEIYPTHWMPLPEPPDEEAE